MPKAERSPLTGTTIHLIRMTLKRVSSPTMTTLPRLPPLALLHQWSKSQKHQVTLS